MAWSGSAQQGRQAAYGTCMAAARALLRESLSAIRLSFSAQKASLSSYRQGFHATGKAGMLQAGRTILQVGPSSYRNI